METNSMGTTSVEGTKKNLRSVSELFQQSWEVYKNNFKQLFLLMLSGYVIMFISMFATSFIVIILLVMRGVRVQFLSPMLTGPTGIAIFIGVLIISLVVILAAIYFSSIFQLACMLTVAKPEQATSYALAFKNGKKQVWGYLAVLLISGILILLWMLLLIIPGLIMAVFYSLALWVYVAENKRGMDAIKRSKELVTGHWWALMGRYVVLYLIFILLSMVLQLIIGNNNASAIVQQIASFLLAPFLIVYSYLIYKDLATNSAQPEITQTTPIIETTPLAPNTDSTTTIQTDISKP